MCLKESEYQRGHISYGTKNLSELEPFTDYDCIGHIKDNNGTVYNTSRVPVQIDCGM